MATVLAEKLCPGRVDRVDNTRACLRTVPKMDLLDLDGLTDLTEIKKMESLWTFPEMTSKNLVWGSQISGNAHLYHLGPICWPSTRPRPVRLQSLLVKVTGPNPKPCQSARQQQLILGANCVLAIIPMPRPGSPANTFSQRCGQGNAKAQTIAPDDRAEPLGQLTRVVFLDHPQSSIMVSLVFPQ
jgi:hypothetical protein